MNKNIIFLTLILFFSYLCFPYLSADAGISVEVTPDFDENDYPQGLPTRTFDFTVKITITDPPQYYTINVGLTSSKFKGIAANAGNSLETDLYFDPMENNDWTVSSDGMGLTAEYNSQNTDLPSKIKVRCRDWGANGKIHVTVSNTSIDIMKRIPTDVNENGIADGWEKKEEHNIYVANDVEAQAKAAADDEEGPGINPNHGDGWSVYDEYRGLYTTVDDNGNPTGHTRLNPTIKDIMYTSHANVEKYGTGALPRVEKHSFTHVDHRLYIKGFDPFTNIYVHKKNGEVGHIDTVDDRIGRVNYNSNAEGAPWVPGAKSVWSIRLMDNGTDGTNFNRLGSATPGSPSQYSLAAIFTTKIRNQINEGWRIIANAKKNVEQEVKDAAETHKASAREKLIPIVIGHEVVHCLNIHANCNHLNCIMNHNLKLIFVADGRFLLIKQIKNPNPRPKSLNEEIDQGWTEFVDATDAERRLIPLSGPLLDKSHINHMAVTGSPGIHNNIEDCVFVIGCVVDDDSDDNANDITTTLQSTLTPASGSYTVIAGNSHVANLHVPSGYTLIYWYIKAPGESGYGASAATTSGDGSSTSASYTYTIPSSVSGDYVLTAYIYLSDSTIVEPNYTITVSDGTTPQPTSPYGLSISNPGQAFQPGDSVTLDLVTSEP